MVTILPNVDRPKKPSFAQKLNEGLSEGLQLGQQLMQIHEQKQRLHKENTAFKKLTGLDIEGITDPKLRQKALEYALQGKQDDNKYHHESQLLTQKYDKESDKLRNTLEKKQEFVNSVLGNPSVKDPSVNPQQMQGRSQQSQGTQGFDAAKMSDDQIARIGAVDSNLGRTLMHQKDVSLREARATREFDEKQRLNSPEYLRDKQLNAEQAKADAKYYQDLQSSFKQHNLKSKTLDNLERLNAKGVTGKPYEKALEKFGLTALTSDGRREFSADVKNLITDIRSILGGQFSQAEFMVVLNAYPSADFSQGANEAIIKNLKSFQDIRSQEYKIADQLIAENGGKKPADFQSKVNSRLQEYAESKVPEIKANTNKIMAEEYGIQPGFVLMFDPQGEPLQVSPEEVEQYQSLGATFP